jgi:hypothetical protein
MKTIYYLLSILILQFLLIPQNLFSYDLSVESIYLENLKCEVHIVLKNREGTIPYNDFSKGKLRLNIPAQHQKSTFSLNQIDPNKELNSKKVLDLNTKYVLKENETVEAVLENIKDSESSNNSKKVDLKVETCKIKEENQKFSRDYEEKYMDHSPFDKHFTLTVNGISPPKAVYVYDSMPPYGPFKPIYINWESSETDMDGMKIEFLGKSDRVLKSEEINSPRYEDYVIVIDEIMKFSDSQTRDGAFLKIKGTLKLKNKKFSRNSKTINLYINLVNGHYYYQDSRTRGVQIIELNNSRYPVLINGLTEDDREGSMNLELNKRNACPHDFPLMKNVKLTFHTTHEDGRLITPQTGYSVSLSDNQDSYSFTMKDLIQRMGLTWSAKWYFISVTANYDCYKQGQDLSNWTFGQHKESNTINIRFMAPLPLI